MIKSFCLLILVFIIASCQGFNDVAEDLGNGYTYLADGSNRTIRSDNTFKGYVYPNVIDFKFDDSYIIVLQKPSSKIESYITEDLRSKYGFMLYMKDSIEETKYVTRFLNSYIWKDSILHKRIAHQILPGNYFVDYDTLNKISKEIIAKDSFFKIMFSRKLNYFIIDKKAQEIYGPFSKAEYISKRKELNVSEKLNLNK